MLVRDLCRFRVTAISMGLNHTAVLTEVGKVITFGKNSEGQLGGGDTKPQQGLIHVRPLNNVSTVVRAQIGGLRIFLGNSLS